MPARRGTFWLLCLATLGNFVAQGLLYPGLPLYLTDELDTSKAVAGLVVSSMSLAAVAFRPWAGGFIDRRGRRPLLLTGPLVTAASGVGLLALASVPAVLAMRVLQGLGNAMTYSAAAAMAADLAPADKRARYLARFGMFFYVGFAVGPWLAELLIASSGFAAVWITVIGSSLAGWALALVLPETSTPESRSGGAAVRLPWRSRLLHPAAVGPGTVFFCVGVGWTALSSFLALYARDIGLGSSDSLFLTLSITVLATRAFAGSVADRVGKAAVLFPCLAGVVVGQVMLAAWQEPTSAYLGLVLYGIGFSGLFPVLFTMVVDRAPDAERGTAMSSFNVFFDLGAPLGGYGAGALIDAGGFSLGLGATAALAGVGGIVLLCLVPGVRSRPVVPPAAGAPAAPAGPHAGPAVSAARAGGAAQPD